ncbi:MAG TPA: undecaprenyl-phosphate glucose phosphotransferase [Lacipirellulaceae bacterium]|nr:undecaprenyl-phosphate glucose phosphotransferase [Lacipirellulaceae bacterium]
MSSVSRGISFHDSFFYGLHRLVDAAVICLAVRAAVSYTHGARLPDVLAIAAATILVYHVVAELSGLYRSWRGSRVRREIACVLITWGYAVPVLLGAGLITQYNAQFSYTSKLIWIFATPITVAGTRFVMRKIQQRLRARGFNTRSFAVCGVNELGIQLARNIQKAPEMGLRLVGFYDDRPVERTAAPPSEIGVRVGNFEELLERAKCGHIDIVYITFPMRAEERIRNVLAALADTTASVYIVPDFFVFELLHARWTNVNGLPAVSVFENPLYGVDGLLKRTADLVFGSLLLVAAALPMAVISLAIKLTSAGPVFFRQQRYGLDGREILVWKFRTMTCCDNGNDVRQATRDDERVTVIGRFLRRTSLDELPQLFNVVEGSMSLVGPRPHANAHNELYRSLIEGYMLRHKVKPGITGLAQVNGYRGETETLEKMEKRIACDHQYIREWSFWMDLKILAKTLHVVLTQRNAY